MEPAITIERLTKRYGSVTAVDELDLTVDIGETYALLGPNGAGKTTTIEILEGLRRATSGTVRTLGLDPIGDHRELHQRVGVMLQEGGIFQAARPLEVLRLFTAFYERPRDPEALLHLVGLDHTVNTPYRRLSGGEKQRLSLALALAGTPELVFLDEPTAGMDPAARKVTWDLVRSLQADGVTIVLTTHYLDEAEQLADRVGIVSRGRLITQGDPVDLMHTGTRATFSAPPGLPTGDVAGVAISEPQPGRYLVEADEITPAIIADVTAWLREQNALIRELRVGAAGLEEVFLELTEEQR